MTGRVRARDLGGAGRRVRLPRAGSATRIILLAAALGAAPGSAQDGPAAEPWLAAPFTAAPEPLLEAARRVPAPAGAEVLMLYQDVEHSFDLDHRATWRRRWVYLILSPSALPSWSASEVRWSPWHQDRPQVRVRVVAPDGRVYEAAAADFEETSEAADDFPDANGRRILRASLPGVEIGAVVEEEIVVRDAAPFFAAGVSGRAFLALPVPIHRGRLTFEAPKALPLRYGVRGVAVEAERTVFDGRVRTVFRYRDAPAAAAPPAGLPPHRPRHPHVAFSSGESWSQVAEAYARLAAPRLATTTAAILGELGPAGGTGVAAAGERAAAILAALRLRLKAIPRELGAAGVVPSAPRATFERGAGDAKDLAAILAALLRAEGIPAFLALVRAGFDQDIEGGLPGLGLFNHALVYVPAGRPLWIDPSDPYSRVGELPAASQGRRALVASSVTSDLVRTPEARSEDNRTVARIDVYLAGDGPGRVVETSEHHGQPERNQRRLAAALDAESRRRGYLDYVRSVYRARGLGEVIESGAGDLTVPYRLRLEALAAGCAQTSGERAAVTIDPRDLLTALPEEVLVPAREPRREDFVFRQPFVSERSYRIYPPPGMKVRSLPDESVRSLGTGVLERRFEVEGDVVHAFLRFDSGPRHLTAEELAAYGTAVEDLLAQEALVVWLGRE